MLEAEWSPTIVAGRGRAAVAHLQAGTAIEPDRAEPGGTQTIGTRRWRSKDNRSGAVAHLDEVHYLASFIGERRKVEEYGPGLRTDNCDGPGIWGRQQAHGDHQRIGEAGTCLAQLDMWPAIPQPVGNEGDIAG